MENERKISDKNTCKPGEFTDLAEDYSKYRPDYSPSVLNGLLGLIETPVSKVESVDVGAGTGIWSRMVYGKGVMSVTAVEPNDEMRSNGMRDSQGTAIQ